MSNPDIAGRNVSRETTRRLEIFEQLLCKWNPRINLVSRASLKDVWDRHIADSIQVFELGCTGRHWVDMGSGGGFPGVIVAILAAEQPGELEVTLVESDQRKAEFLRTVIRETGIVCRVLCDRIELTPPLKADILSARALAALPALLEYSQRHIAPGGTALFSKGVSWEKEVEKARQQWCFDVEVIDSQTMPGAVILKIKGAVRV